MDIAKGKLVECNEEARNFIHNVRIALKELRETRCWIRLIMRSGHRSNVPEIRVRQESLTYGLPRGGIIQQDSCFSIPMCG